MRNLYGNFYERESVNKGFSLIEMILVLTLSSIILISAMSLMLLFTNAYISCQHSDVEFDRENSSKKLVKISLEECKTAEEASKYVSEDLLQKGVFWKTKIIPAFISTENCENFILGLIYIDNTFQFVWAEDNDSLLKESDFDSINLFLDVKSVSLSEYNREFDKWTKIEFNDSNVRNFFNKNIICSLCINCHNQFNFFFL